MAVSIKSNVLWDMTSCKRIDIFCRVRGTYCPIINPKYLVFLKVEAVNFSETLSSYYQTPRRYISEDNSLNHFWFIFQKLFGDDLH
jgi:hypothetical protein